MYPPPRRGVSLFEVILVAFLGSAMLVAGAAAMADSSRAANRAETRPQLRLLAEGRLAELEFAVLRNFRGDAWSGDFRAAGRRDCRYTAAATLVATPELPANRLIQIDVQVFQDLDNDRSFDTDEPNYSIRTLLARRR